jgi:hypothetical protein
MIAAVLTASERKTVETVALVDVVSSDHLAEARC